MDRHAIAVLAIVGIVSLAGIVSVWVASSPASIDEEGNVVGLAIQAKLDVTKSKLQRTAVPALACNDPDGPENVLVKATVTYGSKSGVDTCAGPGTVSEAWCFGGNVMTGLQGRRLACPATAPICHDGSCWRGCTDLNPCPSNYRCNENSLCELVSLIPAPVAAPASTTIKPRTYTCSEQAGTRGGVDRNDKYIRGQLIMRFADGSTRAVDDACVGGNVREYVCGTPTTCVTTEAAMDPTRTCSIASGTVQTELIGGAEARYIDEYCRYGCLNGACKRYPDRVESCDDSGSVIRFRTTGTTGVLHDSLPDACADSSTITDYYCVNRNTIGVRTKTCAAAVGIFCRPRLDGGVYAAACS